MVTMTTYKIVRRVHGGRPRTIKTGLTLDQAEAHCNDPETSSTTATSASAKRLTKKYGLWFDSYTAEN
jgi:hypothetical protein